MLTLAGWASVALIVIAVVNLLLLGGLVYLVFAVRDQIRKLRQQVQPVLNEARSTVAMVRQETAPVLDEARSTLHKVQQTANQITDRVDAVAARAEQLATDVTQRADYLTSTICNRTDEVTKEFTRRIEQISADVTRHSEQVTAQLTDRVDHISTGATERFDRIADDLSRTVQHMLDLGDHLVERVAARVDTTTAVVEEAVTKPLVSLAGVRAGVSKGLEIWRDLSKRAQGDGKKEAEREAEARRMIEEAPIPVQTETVEG
ncbi:MAG: apolipoprotein A1/A4/E family protein [Armatimonadetes bacterium]|nr:apolipoprotein A1/A4/E family protein [Armatimonadota bacterium]